MACNDLTNQFTGNNLDKIDDHNSNVNEEDISNFFSGTHEVQECLEGQSELDLHKHLANCEKNPGHKNFIPVNQLNLEHFPPGYHDNDVFNLTKALADLTVRVAVKFTSPDRPEFLPGTKYPYPCYNTRAQNLLHTGTAMIWQVTKYTEGDPNISRTYRTCPCPECDHSHTPSKVWWRIGVVTVRHVIFDASEARQSSCRLWFDDDISPVVKIYGWLAGYSDAEQDWCQLDCVTHDLDVAVKLEDMVGKFKGLWDKLSHKYKSRRDVDKLAIIVSHPHGCSKQVSVGLWVHRQVVGLDSRTRYTYTTCTCPGSSGAVVYKLGFEWGSYHSHSGANPNSGGLNYSSLFVD
ncbi:uncharacterized protein LOC131944089 [Physella acuta]|uniref:uncharacterized protein LOC131944089 n=1 Tax=Physella acuta TaxID=109671 RepID=UPI0027DAD608|nr:uncharacterized protein LOC131944089 [Physella acuta]